MWYNKFANKDNENEIIKDTTDTFNYPPIISNNLSDGRIVRKDIPNLGSIDASLTDYEELPGIRDVPMSVMTSTNFPLIFHSNSEKSRTEKLAEEIKNSNEINPLIVVYDGNPQGPYILEGGHRFDALRLLNAKSFPALVLIEN